MLDKKLLVSEEVLITNQLESDSLCTAVADPSVCRH